MLHVSPKVLLSAGIIGGLLAYIVINGVNYLLDKLAECMHWSISGTDMQPLGSSGSASGSFIGRMQSNTGGAAQVLHATLHADLVPPLAADGGCHASGRCIS